MNQFIFRNDSILVVIEFVWIFIRIPEFYLSNISNKDLFVTKHKSETNASCNANANSLTTHPAKFTSYSRVADR